MKTEISNCIHCTGEGWEDLCLVLTLNLPKRLPQAGAYSLFSVSSSHTCIKPQRRLRLPCHLSAQGMRECSNLSPWPHCLTLAPAVREQAQGKPDFSPRCGRNATGCSVKFSPTLQTLQIQPEPASSGLHCSWAKSEAKIATHFRIMFVIKKILCLQPLDRLICLIIICNYAPVSTAVILRVDK